jgi:hypothetical protein
MKTLTSTIQQNPEFPMTTGRNIVSAIAASLKEILALFAAVTAAAAIVMLSVWVAGQEINEILGAAIW